MNREAALAEGRGRVGDAMSLRMKGDPRPRGTDTFDVLYRLYQSGSLSVETVLDLLDIDQEDLEAAMRELFPKAGEKLLGDRTALVEQLMELVGIEKPACARCGGTGNIGMISSVRCPECPDVA